MMGKQFKAQQDEAAKQDQIRSLMGSMLMGGGTDEQSQQLAELAPDKFLGAQNYLQGVQAQEAEAASVLNQERDISDLTQMLVLDEAGQNAILEKRIMEVEAGGGDSSGSRFLRDLKPEQRDQYLKMQAGKYNIVLPEGAKADIGTYNPRDYTVDSFASFVESKDPSTLERYAPMKETEVGGVKYFSDDEGNLFLPVVQDESGRVVKATDEQVESGDAKPAPAPEILSAEDQIEAQSKLAGAKKTATAQAAADVIAGSPEAQKQATKNEAFRVDTISVIDSILDSDFDKVTGTAGRLPSVMPKTEDILVQADRLESLLTADNMDIMTGVLSETDIKIISNLAGGFGLERNKDGKPVRIKGSSEAFKDRMEIVKKGLHAVEIVPLLAAEMPDATEGMIVTDSETGYKFVFKNGKWVAK
jgi:hypothetical protein